MWYKVTSQMIITISSIDCLGTVDLNLLERDEMVCPEEVVTFNCTVFSTSLLRWSIVARGSRTQISCLGSSQRCLGGGNGIHATIISASSDPVNLDISNITSTLIIYNIATGISVECESQLTSSTKDIQVLSKLYFECAIACSCTCVVGNQEHIEPAKLAREHVTSHISRLNCIKM